jgi:hypothetical protein
MSKFAVDSDFAGAWIHRLNDETRQGEYLWKNGKINACACYGLSDKYAQGWWKNKEEAQAFLDAYEAKKPVAKIANVISAAYIGPGKDDDTCQLLITFVDRQSLNLFVDRLEKKNWQID